MFDKVYAERVAAPALYIAYHNAYQNMDRGLLEFFGPQGLASEIYRRSRGLSGLPIGLLTRPLSIFLIGLAFILAILGGWA